VLLVHGGGALPYVIGRLARGFTKAPAAMRARATRPPAAFLGSLFFDTIVHDVRALRYLVEVVGARSVVVGTDYPFPLQDPDPVATRAALEDIVSAEDAHLILSANAQRMLASP
jgi:aminocarboxymuconate-semialdehyde decarboxylase